MKKTKHVPVAIHDICQECYEGNHYMCLGSSMRGQTKICYCQVCEMLKEHDE